MDKTVYFSVGHRCSTSHLLRDCGLRCESHPFDWLVSKLDTIEHCILDDFKEFLDISNYTIIRAKVHNVIDNVTINAENTLSIYKNKYYDTSQNDIFNELKLATYYEHKLFEEDYYTRCVNRFKNVLIAENNKVFVYIHPIMGINDYRENAQKLLSTFTDFKKFMDTKSIKLSGIYFIIVKAGSTDSPYDEYVNNDINIAVYTIYTNNDFIDASTPFKGNYKKEYTLIKELFLSFIEHLSTN
jgi:hypothetical protein